MGFFSLSGRAIAAASAGGWRVWVQSPCRLMKMNGVTGRSGSSSEPGPDHIDLEPLELAGDLHLLTQVHRPAVALMPVAQRRVDHDNFVGHSKRWALMTAQSEAKCRANTGECH